MEIRQIIYFLALCEELHFTRAARRCGVAQPSLTNAIRALEGEFGAPLFHRKPRPRLSALGAAIRPELERALAHVERALAHARRSPSRRRTARPMRTEYEPEAFGATRP
jgi:LysR family transcriptional regulator, hydrogen peroxide-inducible genes activator